jgi:hypothetical protein
MNPESPTVRGLTANIKSIAAASPLRPSPGLPEIGANRIIRYITASGRWVRRIHQRRVGDKKRRHEQEHRAAGEQPSEQEIQRQRKAGDVQPADRQDVRDARAAEIVGQIFG